MPTIHRPRVSSSPRYLSTEDIDFGTFFRMACRFFLIMYQVRGRARMRGRGWAAGRLGGGVGADAWLGGGVGVDARVGWLGGCAGARVRGCVGERMRGWGERAYAHMRVRALLRGRHHNRLGRVCGRVGWSERGEREWRRIWDWRRIWGEGGGHVGGLTRIAIVARATRQFVPISLYVSMMFYQTICRYFLLNELECYDAEQDEPCQVRQMALIDELGQVSHVFSDKTGTLTSNHMEFRRCYVMHPQGVAYGCGETAISQSLKQMGGGGVARDGPSPRGGPSAMEAGIWERPASRGPGEASMPPTPYDGLVPPGPREEKRSKLPSFAGCKPTSATYCNFEEAAGAPSLFGAIAAHDAGGAMCREFFLNLAVNHSVLLEKVHGRLELSASSPDEQAFVAAAEYLGFDFVSRDADRGTLAITDKQTGLTHEVSACPRIAAEC